MNLYTVNAPWLFSLLWCTGVPSVTSDNAHALSQVPSPLWIMVSWEIVEGGEVQRAPGGVERACGSGLGGRLHAWGSPVRSQGWGQCMVGGLGLRQKEDHGLWGVH